MGASADPPFDQDQQGVSLEELAAAFARAMGDPSLPASECAADGPQPGAAPSTERSAAEPPQPSPESTEPPGVAEDPDDACSISPRSILEAMLFVGNADGAPLSPGRAAELMRGVEPGEIAGLVDELNARYAAAGCPYHVAGEGNGYRLTLRQERRGLRDRFYGRVREARLSQAAIDALALVAYQQPLTAEQVGRLRGRPSSHILAQLVHRGLLRIERNPSGRRTAQYYTTDRFLELFGLASLDDLPRD
jgi:segregation and condensation protein B